MLLDKFLHCIWYNFIGLLLEIISLVITILFIGLFLAFNIDLAYLFLIAIGCIFLLYILNRIFRKNNKVVKKETAKYIFKNQNYKIYQLITRWVDGIISISITMNILKNSDIEQVYLLLLFGLAGTALIFIILNSLFDALFFYKINLN